MCNLWNRLKPFPKSKWDLLSAVNLSAPFHLMQGVNDHWPVFDYRQRLDGSLGGFMRHQEMPFHSPAIPEGTCRFIDRKYFFIWYKTDPEIIRLHLPTSLEGVRAKASSADNL